MTHRERMLRTLAGTLPPTERGAVLETFHPWDLTVKRFVAEGMPARLAPADLINSPGADKSEDHITRYFDTRMAEPVAAYEAYLGFDPMKRIFMQLPFHAEPAHGQPPAVANREDWLRIREQGENTIARVFDGRAIREALLPLREGHVRGDFSLRMGMEGFFWVPRTLFGIEEHLVAFYDEPELMHEINQWLLEYYLFSLDKMFQYVVPDVLYIMEDLSGANGPMISPAHFDEFVGHYYRQLIPMLKKRGVGFVFVDTDGRFNQLIDNFIQSGVEGFVPMDVNAGMDIVKVRAQYPKLKFIGGYNKLEIAKGEAAIEREFERIMPVIRQGGYIPGADHQVAPSTSLSDYKTYIRHLKSAMAR